MSGANAKSKGLHVATMSGWYRFETDGRAWKQVKRDLSYWTLTCLAVDPENPELIYAGTEPSGLFYSNAAGAHSPSANPHIATLTDSVPVKSRVDLRRHRAFRPFLQQRRGRSLAKSQPQCSKDDVVFGAG